MQIAPDQLAEHLSKRLHALYVVHGDELLLVQEACDTIRQYARQSGHTERSSFTVSGAHFDWAPVLAATGSQSLFGDRQFVEIHIPSGKPGKDGVQQLQALAHMLQGQEDCVALVCLGRLDKVAKSSAWFTALESSGVVIQVDNVERHQLAPWIAARMRQYGLLLPQGAQGQYALGFLAEQVEGNLLAANQEIQKLALLYPGTTLTLEHLQEAVGNVARYDVFKLSEAVLGGQGPRTQKMLDGLRSEGVAEVLVHWVLSEDIRSLHHVCRLLQSGKSIGLALRESRVWGAKERLFERIAPKLRPRPMAQLLQAAYHCEGIIKGIRRPDWPSDSWQALHRLAGLMVKIAAR